MEATTPEDTDLIGVKVAIPDAATAVGVIDAETLTSETAPAVATAIGVIDG